MPSDSEPGQQVVRQANLTTAPSLSLPKGGGAIRGMGEKFAANPVTGTGSMTVPIATSPGRSGLSPQLAISYDSGAGNGPFGFGWSLSLPSITRKTDKGLPRYLDAEESDVFVLSGAEDLVPVLVEVNGKWRPETLAPITLDGQNYRVRRYRPRIEGLFARIERWTNLAAGDIHWRTITRDNITTLYGKTAESRIADPGDPSRIFSWLICQSYDDKGNAIVYTYAEENSDGLDFTQVHEKNRTPVSRSSNRYLKRIHYGNRRPNRDGGWKATDPSLLPDSGWMFEVVFDYGDHDVETPHPKEPGKQWARRLDPFSSYRSGFEIRTYRLCQRVLMFHHFSGEEGVGQDCLVRSTDFTYAYEETPADPRNPIFSFLLSVTQSGYKRRSGGYLKKSLPPLEFQYSQPAIDHDRQIDNSQEADQFLRSKFTNQDLYQHMIGQVSGLYFQSYQLAYELAKRAERCFRFELGLQDSSYINFGYWDSLKKGLLAGEKLQYDLRRLETAYMEENRREFELTKHVSLALLDPLALVRLRETGRCDFQLPEEIFDLDYPGHYFRRIKSVSITLPCVVGPYTTISSTLRLVKNSVRIKTGDGNSGYPRNTDDQGLPADDDRFVENSIPVRAIAASHGQNDSGMFELSFRDERYLPFEGAGAISEWSLELFHDTGPDHGKPLRQFDYGTISDVIVHVKYTAREDAGVFKNAAVAHLRDYFSKDGKTPSLRMFNLRQEFPTQWHRFVNPADPSLGNLFNLEMTPKLFPLRDQGKTLKVNTIWLLARCTDTGNYTVTISPPLPSPVSLGVTSVDQYGGLHFPEIDVPPPGIEILPSEPPITWQLTMTREGNLLGPEVEEILLVLGYKWED